MDKPQDTGVPTVTPLAEGLLELGKATHDYSEGGHRAFRPGSACPPIPDTAKVISLINATKDGQKVFSFHDGEPDVIEIRVLAVTAWIILFTERTPSVSWVSRLVGGEDPKAILLSRAAIRRLCVRRVLLFRNGENKVWDGLIYLAPTTSILLGMVEANGCVFSEGTLAKSVIRAQRNEEPAEPAADISKGIPSPHYLYNAIRQHVIGMDPIVRAFVARLRLHLLRIEQLKKQKTPTGGTPSEVLLFLGPSGSGKTFLAETGGRICGLPFGSFDLSGVSEDGYCGASVADVVRPVIQAADGDVNRAKYGIIFADELDSKRASTDVGRDVSGGNVQKSLLKLVEGCEYQVGGRRGGFDPPLTFDSRYSMWVFAGAFVDLDAILSQQSRPHGSIGFTGPSADKGFGQDIHAALERFGILPELVNRLTGIISIPPPTVMQLVSIAKAPLTGVVASYARLLKEGGLDLRVTDAALVLMAEACHANRTYARGLKAIMSKLVEEAVFGQASGRIAYGVAEVRAALSGDWGMAKHNVITKNNDT